MEAPTSNGIPMLGLGTWQNDSHEQCAQSVKTALEMGYRHVDTAQAYRNEEAVGDGIESASVDREDVFLATKIWTSNLSHEDVLSSTEASLDRLGTDYVDLLYVHWPAEAYDPESTMAAFDHLAEEGSIDRIGVSNFEPHHVERAREVLETPVSANQIELHPLLQQRELRKFARETDLELVAYSPLARGEVFSNETICAIADKHGVSEAQVSLAWLRELGVTAIPKATGDEHIRDNWESLSLELDSKDLERIEEIEETQRKVHPDFAPDSWE